MSDSLNVVIASAEMVPFAKTGGLADVTGALPKALAKFGHDVRVVLPRYGLIDPVLFHLVEVIPPFSIPMGQSTEQVSISKTDMVPGITVYFVNNDTYFANRENIYGYPDDGERFILFCRAAMEMIRRLDWKPDVVHANDWHTGIIPNWLETIYRKDPLYSDTGSVFTIHNLQYQGLFGKQILEFAGIDQFGFIHNPQISHTTPTRDQTNDYHWHLELIPKMSIPAGFELGSGVMINVTTPEAAAEFLRGASLSGTAAPATVPASQ